MLLRMTHGVVLMPPHVCICTYLFRFLHEHVHSLLYMRDRNATYTIMLVPPGEKVFNKGNIEQ